MRIICCPKLISYANLLFNIAIANAARAEGKQQAKDILDLLNIQNYRVIIMELA